MALALAEFALRTAATAFVVIGVTLVVQHLGARAGGIVAGLPVVIGPGLYFLLLEQGPAFVSQAAVNALFAVAASVVFAWCFARSAVRRTAVVSLFAAVAAWAAAIAVMQLLPETLLFAIVAFCAAVVATHLLGHDPAAERAPPAAARRPIDLALRGLAAGVLVGIVALTAPFAGPGPSGVLLAFPVVLTVIGVTLHQRYGGPVAARTLATTQLSMSSIAAFAATLVLLLDRLPAQAAFWLAVAASFVPTATLSLWRYVQSPTTGGPADGR